ncbi:hypothetical protein PILCRDRAFT_311020 [Piloderma croceum F 1598]|uniref:Uncharacterized protein n=1 Tax=Piloderma croceum (strain F 1598) TaxID=765440 RepID=A0A0C3FRU3_PILCF|nr:hypothetical protein PILCRDRAFT_311020 [Piloderma croceum F 1598]
MEPESMSLIRRQPGPRYASNFLLLDIGGSLSWNTATVFMTCICGAKRHSPHLSPCGANSKPCRNAVCVSSSSQTAWVFLWGRLSLFLVYYSIFGWSVWVDILRQLDEVASSRFTAILNYTSLYGFSASRLDGSIFGPTFIIPNTFLTAQQ